MSDRRLPITVIGGYLGAGKTTLVNHVLTHAQEPIAVLVNDFGDLDVDAALIAANDNDVISFTNGCVCCDLSDGLIAALDRIRSRDPGPTRVLIEASGVSELATIANYASLPGFRLDASVCIVDAESIDMRSSDRWVGDLVVAQLRAADLIVCNKVDLADGAGRERARERIATIAPGTVVIEARNGVVDLDVLFDRASDGTRSGTTASTATQASEQSVVEASEGFESWVSRFAAPIPIDDLRNALDALPASVARAKGFVRVADEAGEHAVVVQVVGRRRLMLDAPGAVDAESALTFIAVRAEFDDATMPALFQGQSRG